jgi:voltage-gated potassium channel
MPLYRVLAPAEGKRYVREWRRRVFHLIGLFILAILLCATGLVALDESAEPWSAKAFRALWNAVNMITTLGDFTPFNDRQKTFMLVTMLGFLLMGGYAVSKLTGLLSNEAVMLMRENRMAERQLEALSGHVMVIGFGPVGRLVAERVKASGAGVVILERQSDLAAQASALGYLVVEGDAGSDETVFARAAVERAKALVVAIDDPDRKLAITLMAHSRNPRLRIAVTGPNRERGALLRRAGATEVIIADEHIAEALVARLDAAPAAPAAPDMNQ